MKLTINDKETRKFNFIMKAIENGAKVQKLRDNVYEFKIPLGNEINSRSSIKPLRTQSTPVTKKEFINDFISLLT
jgi:hypothetical protein